MSLEKASTLIYILRHESKERRRRTGKQTQDDPKKKKREGEDSEMNGKLVDKNRLDLHVAL